MPYMVYLYDGLAASSPLNRITLSSQEQNTVQQTLKRYFDQIVTAHDKLGRQGQVQYGTSIVQWIQPPFPPIHVHELLVYLVPPGTTVVTHGKLEQGTAASNHGNTHAIPNPPGTSGSTWGSEVWPLFNSTPGASRCSPGLFFTRPCITSSRSITPNSTTKAVLPPVPLKRPQSMKTPI